MSKGINRFVIPAEAGIHLHLKLDCYFKYINVSVVRLGGRLGHKNVLGGNSGRATPVPIPNTEVKPACVDGTAPWRVWESRTLPG